ncbi:MAG: pentapeptide repeat-containing protein, partial [Cyanobacteria bacterium J06643_5]
MVQIEFLRQLWRNCLRQSWLEEVLHTASRETKTVAISLNPKHKASQQVEYKENDSPVLSFARKLQVSLIKWAQINFCVASSIEKQQFYQDIYTLLGNIALKPQVVESAIKYISSEKADPKVLFRNLEDFYFQWCDGEFIDAVPDKNLPQSQMLRFQAENIAIGMREVDINAGLNVMILLLELHRWFQEHNQELTFCCSGKPDSDNFFSSRLLRAINYSDSIRIGNFSSVVGEFLRGASLKNVYLGDANLRGANFSNADLSGAYLEDANLAGIRAKKVKLSHANLGDA